MNTTELTAQLAHEKSDLLEDHPCEPWSHPWHDQLGLLYHEAMAEKVRSQPALLEIARNNLRRWFSAEPTTRPSLARQEWEDVLNRKDMDEIIRRMTDPGEEGNRRRQSTPFVGIVTGRERSAIRDKMLA